jgi:hypothetical protein
MAFLIEEKRRTSPTSSAQVNRRLLSYCGFLLWCWATWLRSNPKILENWRSPLLLVALLTATVSVTLNSYLYVHAMYTGGYPFYHPVELMCIRWGTLTALLGIVAAAIGTGKGRIPLARKAVLQNRLRRCLITISPTFYSLGVVLSISTAVPELVSTNFLRIRENPGISAP